MVGERGGEKNEEETAATSDQRRQLQPRSSSTSDEGLLQGDEERRSRLASEASQEESSSALPRLPTGTSPKKAASTPRGSSAQLPMIGAGHSTPSTASGAAGIGSSASASSCGSCSRALVEGARFCAFCGAAATATARAAQSTAAQASFTTRGDLGFRGARPMRGIPGNGSLSARSTASGRRPLPQVAAPPAPLSARSAPSRPAVGASPGRSALQKSPGAARQQLGASNSNLSTELPSEATSNSRSATSTLLSGAWPSVAEGSVGFEGGGGGTLAGASPAKGGGGGGAAGSQATPAAAASAVTFDDSVQSVHQRLCKALAAHYRKRGVHTGVIGNWQKLFSDIDSDGSGKLTFEEFDDVVRNKLAAAVSRYELRLFWRRFDADRSGLVTLREFTQFMYRVELSTWPVLSAETLGECVTLLNATAERLYHSGGNWFKIFRYVDADGSGKLTYEEFRRCIRDPLPGLGLTVTELSDTTLRGLWRAIDSEGSELVNVKKYTAFMRRHGASHSMHKLTSYSKKKRGLDEQSSADLGPVPERSRAQLAKIGKQLEQALQAYWAEKGVHHNTHCKGGNWGRFFSEVDTDGSGRLLYNEFIGAFTSKLGKWAINAVGCSTAALKDDLRAIWALADANNSGEVTAAEACQTLYRLELETYPDPTPELLERVVGDMNASAAKWHRASGNWYKIFNMVDAEGTGIFGFDDLRRLVRSRYPGLELKAERVTEDDLRAFWKALDSNLSGDSTVKEFMVLMRRHGAAQSMHKLTKYSAKKRGVLQDERDLVAELSSVEPLSDERLLDVATRLTQVLHRWLSKRGVTCGVARSTLGNPRLWSELFAFIDRDHSERLSFQEFEHAVATELRADREFSPEELRAFWRGVDADCSGEVTALEFARGVYIAQIKAFPLLDEEHLIRIVEILNDAADRWHQCRGNWYKVFAKVDEDGSGQMAFDELVIFIRRTYPCLAISQREISEMEIQGLWRALDFDESGKVTTKEFLAFMRRQGAHLNMHRLTTYSLQKRGQLKELGPMETAPVHSREKLRSTAALLDEALAAVYARKGIHVNMFGSWQRLFSETDTDRSGRLSFPELEGALKAKLRNAGANPVENGFVCSGVSHEDLLGLFAAVDANGSGEVTAKEWFLALYELELEGWPDTGEDRLHKVVDTLDESAEKWHNAGGNWMKVFRMVDSDLNMRLSFEEFREVVRRPLPCLAIPAKKVSHADLQSLWTRLDTDRSGEVTVQEFMRFMRQHGSRPQLHERLGAARAARPSRAASRAKSSVPAEATLSSAQVYLLCEALSRRTEKDFQVAFKRDGRPWTGMLSEWDLLLVCRDVLQLPSQALDDDGVFAAWRWMDKAEAGQISVAALLDLARGQLANGGGASGGGTTKT
eukprot:TRINITY_DN14157_c0_g1_i1.p1 TRINITY_DN14157_c0_g1~~TRINITY_DN14157_c0_g1_i1.p1  ORF type:complete len:1380 (-),score=321.70 TRINITY_DN14157_c0_g1_i1:204-4343(-)